MRNRIIAIAMAAAVVFAIPVVASAQEGDEAEAPTHTRPPIDIEERFETLEEAIAAVSDRMTSALERVSDRYAKAQENEDVSEEVLEKLATAIENLETTIAEVNSASDFDELNTILEEVREQRREFRAERRRHRCGFERPGELGESAETTT